MATLAAPQDFVSTLAESALERAVIEALLYGDIFDYPLTVEELVRYVPVRCGSAAELGGVLRRLALEGRVERRGVYVTLPARHGLVERRRARFTESARLWPQAVRYADVIARLPFVRMVAVSGALAVDNVERGADIDYFIVTVPGRLWLCRALVVGVVRWAARREIALCPNYLLSERALTLGDRNLFTAHEVAQLVPLAGAPIYQRLRRANDWVDGYLPNAQGAPPQHAGRIRPRSGGPGARLVERLMAAVTPAVVERWEMTRKIRKFRALWGEESDETAFDPDRCKGHFGGNAARVLGEYAARHELLLGGGAP